MLGVRERVDVLGTLDPCGRDRVGRPSHRLDRRLSIPRSGAAFVKDLTVVVAVDHDVLSSGPVGEAFNRRGEVRDP